VQSRWSAVSSSWSHSRHVALLVSPRWRLLSEVQMRCLTANHIKNFTFCGLFVIFFFCSFEASVKSTRPWFRRCLLFCWSVRSYTWKYFWLRHFKELHLHLVSIHHYPLWLSGYHNNVGNLSKRTLIYLKIGNAYIYMEYIVSRSIS